jgi:hypothetical protein
MAYIFAIPVLLICCALVYGGLTGRVRMSSCCSVADPSKDLRMRELSPNSEHANGDAPTDERQGN